MAAIISTDRGQASVSNLFVHDPYTGTYSTTAVVGTSMAGMQITAKTDKVGAKKTEALSTATPDGTIVGAILRSTSVYHDAAVVLSSFQVRDSAAFSANTHAVKIVVKATPKDNADLKTIQKEQACGGSSPGVCHITVNVGEIFDSLADDEVYTITYGESGSDAASFAALGDVTLMLPAASAVDDKVVDTVYTSLPAKALYAGDTFEVEVRSRFKVYLKTVRIVLAVGSGLELVVSQVKYPKQDGKSDAVFATTKAVGDNKDKSSDVTVILAGRKDDKKAGALDSSTDELLFTVRVRVANGVKNGATATLQITKLDELGDLDGNNLAPSQSNDETRHGIILSRDGPMDNAGAEVHFATDMIAGIFGYANGPSEMMNTAVLSSKPVISIATAVSVYTRGSTESVTAAECSTDASDVITLDDCFVRLEGGETKGSPEAKVTVKAHGYAQDVSFRVYYPTSVSLNVSTDDIRPIAGWYDADANDCVTLLYYQSFVTGTALFSDTTDNEIKGYDVTSLLKLESSDTGVAKIADGAMIVAVDTGDATLQAVSTVGIVLADVQVTVRDQSPANQLAVIGLDIVVLKTLGAISTSPKQTPGRQSEVVVTVGAPTTAALKFEDDSMIVVVSAVFEDHSKLELNANNGLVLSANFEESLVVKALAQQITVPFDPVGAVDQPLVNVAWQPNAGGSCDSDGISGLSKQATQNVTLTVTPPPAESMIATVNNNMIVCVDDPAAASGTGFSTTAQILVSLKFPQNKIVSGLADDKRTQYVLADDTDLFTVDQETGTITANAEGEVGEGIVNISFAGQNVTGTVTVKVAKFADLTTAAVPEPAYASSGNVDASTLSAIGCTEPLLYQQARLVVTMSLENSDKTKVLAESLCDFDVAPGRRLHERRAELDFESADHAAAGRLLDF